MRLPKIRELTQEQKEVYLYAPKDKHVLVQGPPGTGKTLIACLRAAELRNRNIPVALGMFSRVLVKYASNAGDEAGNSMPSCTLYSWFRDWWNAAKLPPHPAGGDIFIQVPYEERGAVREAGARWNKDAWRPWEQKKGAWMIDFDRWKKCPSNFSAWCLWQGPPMVENDRSQFDWDAVYSHVMDFEESIPDEILNLGTLLIDEGQDFPPGLYRFLRLLSVLSASPGRNVKHPLKCFILADENQQLTDLNSTLKEIQEALKISDDNRYLLQDNFRNTCEIAELARSFFNDVGVLPKLPKRSGERPSYSECADIEDCVKNVMTWAANHPGKEIGVLVFTDAKRQVLADALTKAVSKVKGQALQVQTYSWSTRQQNKVNDLLFDKPNVITVLNMQSCKGLEFDAVFIIDLHEAQIGLYGPGRFRMQMFVGVSRAREWVQLLESKKVTDTAPFRQELPDSEFLVRGVDHNQVPPVRQVLTITRKSKVVIQKLVPKQEEQAGKWVALATAFAQRNGFQFEDLRPAGCFWVYASKEQGSELEKQGFRYTPRRNGWWKL